MVITRGQLDALIAQARAEYPNEACGILAGKDDRVVAVYPMRNAEQSPVQYAMDPNEQLHVILEIEDRDWEMAAIYHSHTHTPARPSPTDIRLAGYPEALYLILSLATDPPEVRAFRIAAGHVSEETLQVADA